MNFFRWSDAKKGIGQESVSAGSSTTSLNGLIHHHTLPPTAEDLTSALAAIDLIMDDQIHEARDALHGTTSAYHKLAGCVLLFLQAAFGIEPEMVKEAVETLNDAESSTDRELKRAVHAPSASKYPAGSEFLLANAESQFMAALLGFISESVVESIKGLYRLRSAFKTLKKLNDTVRSESTRSESSRSSTSSDDFVDATDDPASLPATVTLPPPSTKAATSPIDFYIESGSSTCLGAMRLILSIIPPALGKILSIVGFHGDRQEGLDLLWSAALAPNVHGAIATLTLLQYYGGIMQFCDILTDTQPKHALSSGSETIYPRERVKAILKNSTDRYPNSSLWQLQVARDLSVNGNGEQAVELLENLSGSQMVQISALVEFELALNHLFLHSYESAARSFLRLRKLNNWSHAFYTYTAACCKFELYRQTRKSEYGDEATRLFEEAPTLMGKKFFGRTMSFEVFLSRKLKKWHSKAIDGNILPAIGISPVEEIIYFWNGHRRMSPASREKSLAALQARCELEIEEMDDKAVRHVLKSVVLRNQRNCPKAKVELEEVLSLSPHDLRHGQNPDEWPLPAAHYEMAAVLWAMNGYNAAGEVREWLHKAAEWKGYEMETRIGIRIQTGQETLRHSSEDK